MHRDHIQCFRGNLDLYIHGRAARGWLAVPLEMLSAPVGRRCHAALENGVDRPRHKAAKLLVLLNPIITVIELVVWIIPILATFSILLLNPRTNERDAILIVWVGTACLVGTLVGLRRYSSTRSDP